MVTSRHGREANWVALLALTFVIGACTGDIDDIDPGTTRAPTGVAGKPLVQTPTGLAIADELVVGFRGNKSPSEVESIAALYQGERIWTAPRSGYHVLRFADMAAATDALRGMSQRGDVAEILRNRIARGTGIGTSPVILRGLQWNMVAMGIGTDGSHGSASGVTVAVIDTGVAFEDYSDSSGVYARAPGFTGTNFAAGYDFINDDSHANDDQGHGTHIAGIIAAGEGIAAVAPGATVMPVKVLDSGSQGTELALAEGISFAADNGADVINLSLAFPPSFFPSRLLQQAVSDAASSGAVMVAAVGNDGAQVVTYPAAFRQVFAVGASKLKRGLRYKNRPGWTGAHKHLRPASYSNRGRLVDVVAPAGVIDGDANRDGNPEAVLAMSFQGDPTDFDYYFYSGTSQAAAQVSGLAATMRATSPSLGADQIRAILGETAKAKSWKRRLHKKVGRGYVRGADAIELAGDPDQIDLVRPHFYVAISLTIEERGNGDRTGRAEVQLVDQAGEPVKGFHVYGTFTGSAYQSMKKKTKKHGTAVFRSPVLSNDGQLVAFQVEAVTGKLNGKHIVDRPSGFISIDTCSLGHLSAFAKAAGIGTSPGPVVEPMLDAPITMLMPEISNKQIPTLLLLNYSWGMATVPMAVAVDAVWFDQQFVGADQLRVKSFGTGIGTSPIVVLPDTSFPTPIPAMPDTDGGSGDVCMDLQLRTFDPAATGIGTSPGPLFLSSCSAGSCASYQSAVADMFAFATGIGTSPVWTPGSGVPQTRWQHLDLVVSGYVNFGWVGDAAPVGDYGAVLNAAGIGVTPIMGGGGNTGVGSQAMSD